MLSLLRKYNMGMAKLKQYDYETVDGVEIGFNYEKPDSLIEAVGMKPEEETMLTTVLSNELKQQLAKQKKVSVFQIELKMTHVKDIEVDYDYLTELIEKLLNEVHNKDNANANETREKIIQFANGLEDREYANKIIEATKAIINGDYPNDPKFTYPAKLDKGSEIIIQEASNISLDRRLQDFRIKWGIIDIITSAKMRELFSKHKYGQQDLDQTGQIRDMIAKASVRLRQAIYELADELVNY